MKELTLTRPYQKKIASSLQTRLSTIFVDLLTYIRKPTSRCGRGPFRRCSDGQVKHLSAVASESGHPNTQIVGSLRKGSGNAPTLCIYIYIIIYIHDIILCYLLYYVYVLFNISHVSHTYFHGEKKLVMVDYRSIAF